MNGIEISGFEELERLVQGMTLTDGDASKAMKSAVKVIADEVDSNAPERTKNLKKNIKTTVTKEGFATVGTVKLGAFYSMFQEFGTSRSKKNAGFFERSVNARQDEAISILAKEILSKVK